VFSRLIIRYTLIFLGICVPHSLNGVAHISHSKYALPQHARPLIIVDPGHGGSDEGATSGGAIEKELALTTSVLLRNYLYELGYRVIMTRHKDLYIPLDRRVSIANRTHATLFVSLHYNSASSSEAYGAEVFYCGSGNPFRVKQSKKLASLVLKQLILQANLLSRGIKRGNFYVIRHVKTPAILVEGGFITNSKERFHLLHDTKHLERIARGVALGVDQYIKWNQSTFKPPYKVK